MKRCSRCGKKAIVGLAVGVKAPVEKYCLKCFDAAMKGVGERIKKYAASVKRTK